MIRASIQVTDKNGHFMVVVHADTLRQAVDFAINRYPDCAVGVRFPLDPGTFFVGGSSDEADTVELSTAQ